MQSGVSLIQVKVSLKSVKKSTCLTLSFFWASKISFPAFFLDQDLLFDDLGDFETDIGDLLEEHLNDLLLVLVVQPINFRNFILYFGLLFLNGLLF